MDTAERYRKVAAGFSRRVRGVPAGAWDNPAPCEGWVARDVVRHLVEWMPSMFLAGPGLAVPPIPSPDDDPPGAWEVLDRALQAALDDPETAGREFESRAGRHTVEAAIGMFGTPDVLIHTWDLARATGLDETLDPDEVHDLFVGMEPHDDHAPPERPLRAPGRGAARRRRADETHRLHRPSALARSSPRRLSRLRR